MDNPKSEFPQEMCRCFIGYLFYFILFYYFDEVTITNDNLFDLFFEILIYYNQNSTDIYNQIAIETLLLDSSMAKPEQPPLLNTGAK